MNDGDLGASAIIVADAGDLLTTNAGVITIGFYSAFWSLLVVCLFGRLVGPKWNGTRHYPTTTRRSKNEWIQSVDDRLL